MSTESETKTYSWDDLKKPEHQDKKGLLMLIHGKVYSISKFLDEVSWAPTLCSSIRRGCCVVFCLLSVTKLICRRHCGCHCG